jgi:hypothetical protein
VGHMIVYAEEVEWLSQTTQRKGGVLLPLLLNLYREALLTYGFHTIPPKPPYENLPGESLPARKSTVRPR